MTDDDKVDNDFNYSRDTYYELIEKGKEGIEEMLEVARNSEHPRAYEVLSKLIKDVGDINSQLMDLNKKNKDIKKEEQPKLDQKTTNNIFVGSTTDLQKLIRNAEKDITPNGE